MSTQIVCMHCKGKVSTVAGLGEKVKGKFCRYCGTKEKRAEMDKVNKEINPNFHCPFCEGERKSSE